MDQLTAHERQIIEQAVEAGNITRVPAGRSGLPAADLVWNADEGRLKYRNSADARRALLAGKQGRPSSMAVAKRRERVRRMAHDGATAAKIAETLGVKITLVYRDAQRLGINLQRQPGSGRPPAC